MTKIIFYILIFLLQVMLFNHLDISRFLFPQVFIALLISMPVHWNKSLQIALGFGLGLSMDFFVSTPGLHASACLFVVLIRMGLLLYIDTTKIVMDKRLFTIYSIGNAAFFRVMGGLVLFYHAYVFLFEGLGNLHLLNYIITVLASSLLSIMVISLFQFLFYRGVNAAT